MFLIEEVIEQTPAFLHVSLTEVDGFYRLTCSPSLVQAFGEACGIEFSFRAKNGEWEFEVLDRSGDPFLRLADVYDESKPGGMGMDWSARLLRRCLEKWIGN
jgi:hypothetical protein